MKTISRLLLLSLPLASAWPLQAAFNPAIVPADAKWVLYADLNVLRNSTLGKEIVATAEKELGKSDAPVIPNIEKILTTIGSATAYGSVFTNNPDAMDGALVVQGTADLRKIAESLLLSQTIASPEHVVEITDLGFPAYGIKSGPAPAPAAKKDDGKDGAPPVVKKSSTPATPRDPNKIEIIVAFPPENAIFVSRSRDQIVKARDLFAGKGASLAKSANSPLKAFMHAADDSYLFGASITPPDKMFPTDAPQARVLKMASAGSIALGEHAAEAYAHAELLASSDDMADKLMKILQGMTAVISLTEANDKQLGEFLNAATVLRDGDRVILNLSYPSARLIQMAQNYRTPTERPTGNRNPGPQLVFGKSVGEWSATPYAADPAKSPNIESSHVVENVSLVNGSIITLARNPNGAAWSRYTRVEVVPSHGGAPLVFKASGMQPAGPRNSAIMFEFPGVDGTYNLNVVYSANDPEGKTKYVVSVREPRPAPPAPTVRNN